MPRMSAAPDLARVDGLTSLERARRQPLMLGLFIPLQQGAWSPSTLARGTSWDFEYNAECAVRADEFGFDLVFVLAQWLGDAVGQRLPIGTQSDAVRHMIGFVLVFVVSVFVGGLLVWGLPKLIERAGLRPVDRVLGGFFGLLRVVILTLALAVLVQMTPAKSQGWWRDSLVADTSLWTLKKMKPVLPDGVGKYLP